MAVDMFLRLDKIPGEAQDAKHADEIDVLAWSWGCSQSGTVHVGGGGGSGKAAFQDLSVTKFVDASSVTLTQYLTKGTHIDTATLTVRKAGDKPLEYITLDLEDIIVTSISTGGSGGEDRLTENVSLNFRVFKTQYKQQDQTGAEKKAFDFKFDIAKNISV